MTLAESLRAKEHDIATARSEGKEFTLNEISWDIFHRLIVATNRRMHKGFPEMLSYLMKKPIEYSSDAFVSVMTYGIFNQMGDCSRRC